MTTRDDDRRKPAHAEEIDWWAAKSVARRLCVEAVLFLGFETDEGERIGADLEGLREWTYREWCKYNSLGRDACSSVRFERLDHMATILGLHAATSKAYNNYAEEEWNQTFEELEEKLGQNPTTEEVNHEVWPALSRAFWDEDQEGEG
jgi:hypothetical protein